MAARDTRGERADVRAVHTHLTHFSLFCPPRSFINLTHGTLTYITLLYPVSCLCCLPCALFLFSFFSVPTLEKRMYEALSGWLVSPEGCVTQCVRFFQQCSRKGVPCRRRTGVWGQVPKECTCVCVCSSAVNLLLFYSDTVAVSCIINLHVHAHTHIQ